MTLYFDGETAFFKTRGKNKVQNLFISVESGEALLCNGVRYPAVQGVVYLPRVALRHGENTLALLKDKHLFPCESLMLEGDTVFPCAMPTESILLHLWERVLSQEKTISSLTKRLSAAEARLAPRHLFS